NGEILRPSGPQDDSRWRSAIRSSNRFRRPEDFGRLLFLLTGGAALIAAWREMFCPKTQPIVYLCLFFVPFSVLLLAVFHSSFSSLVRSLTAIAGRRRLWVLLGVVASLALTVYVYQYRLAKEFLSDSTKDEFIIFVELPSGSKLDVSDKVVAAVEN